MEQQQYRPIGSNYVARQHLENGLAGVLDLRWAATIAHAELVRAAEIKATTQAAADSQVTENSDGRTRRDDPETSHRAAIRLRSGTVRAAVLRLLVERGPMADVQITRALRAQGSGPRTRRSELVELGYVEATDRVIKVNGHQHIVWQATQAGRDWVSRNTTANIAAA